MSSRVPPPKVNPKDLYTWASSELLDECSCFLSTRAIREHKGDSCSYDHCAFVKRHDDDIAVLPCTLGEPVCGDERANDGSLSSISIRWCSRASACSCPSPGSVMDASKRMMLAKAMKDARAAKAGASPAPAADPNPPSTLPPPPPTTTEAPLGSSSPSSHNPEALQTPDSPLPIAAVPLAVASPPAPTPLDKGKRVLEIISDDEDSDGVAPFKRRKSARVPLLPAVSPQGEDSFRDNPPSATSLPPTIIQEEIGEGAESAPPPPPAEVEVSRLRVEKKSLEKQVASGDATIEELEKDKKTLVNDMEGTFEEGFQEALAQAVCENSGIDVSNCDSTHHIVDGKVVPLELDD
ncbi:uncharacterized protein [Phaseolus vulgaris]|uniref:uncharacterized protein n=1 Tax=Phaseolus vulgaris TaxID=3885 RepID=UPI0035CC2BD0